jgi:hypothetical protein
MDVKTAPAKRRSKMKMSQEGKEEEEATKEWMQYYL